MKEVFSGKYNFKTISCLDCADFTQGFCKGHGLKGDRDIDGCIEFMATKLAGSCEMEIGDDGDLTVTLTHESPSGIIHPHMYGISRGIAKKMGRKLFNGRYEVGGGCECDWGNLAFVK